MGASSVLLAGSTLPPFVCLLVDSAPNPSLNRYHSHHNPQLITFLCHSSFLFAPCFMFSFGTGIHLQITFSSTFNLIFSLSLHQFYTYTLGDEGPMLVGALLLLLLLLVAIFEVLSILVSFHIVLNNGRCLLLVGDSSSVIVYSKEDDRWLWLDRQGTILMSQYLLVSQERARQRGNN